MNDTPTPRTDAYAKSIDQSNFEDSWKDDFEEFAWVTADFARTLETELTAVTEQRDEARKLAEKYRYLSCDSQEEADETLLPWENDQPTEL